MKIEFKPVVAIPPGETIKGVLKEKGWSQKYLAIRLVRPEKFISEMINGKTRITEETAIQLERKLGISAEMLLNLETTYRLILARKKREILASSSPRK